MAQQSVRGYRGVIVLAVVAGTVLGVGAAPASAEVTQVTASAYGFYSDVSLFGGPSSERGPEPTVTLAADAANSPQNASVESAQAVYGPAEVFRSGPIEVHAEGSLGEDGSVTSSATVQGDPDPEARPGPLLFEAMDSTCTADEDGVEATATVSGGLVETRYDPQTQQPVETVPVPENPEPGHTVEGTIDHVGDRYRIVFNEQTTNPDGSVTVNAAHVYLLGDIAVGDLIIGQSVCGVTATPTADTTTTTTTTTTTVPPTTTTLDEDLTATDDDDGGVPTALVVVGSLLGLAVVVAAVLLIRRRTAGGEPGEDATG